MSEYTTHSTKKWANKNGEIQKNERIKGRNGVIEDIFTRFISGESVDGDVVGTIVVIINDILNFLCVYRNGCKCCCGNNAGYDSVTGDPIWYVHNKEQTQEPQAKGWVERMHEMLEFVLFESLVESAHRNEHHEYHEWGGRERGSRAKWKTE